MSKLLIFQHTFLAYSLFRENKEAEANEHFRHMETELQDSGSDGMVEQELIGLVYAEAGAFYFRKKNYQKARELILAGLQKTPDHNELKERLKIVEDEIKRH